MTAEVPMSTSQIVSSFFPRYWCVVPAAGSGARMGAAIPKQYLTVNGQTILEHTLEKLLQLPTLSGLFLALNPSDNHWINLPISRDPRITRVDGGSERSHSVLNALNFFADQASDSDWVLVHDAARPCVTLSAIKKLIEQLAADPVGGILATPVSDTLKQVDDSHQITRTVHRAGLWQAQTPQMFRYGLLRSCLQRVLAEKTPVTDEASALEICGYISRIVQGRADNIKITHQEDLNLAGFILQQQKLQQE